MKIQSIIKQLQAQRAAKSKEVARLDAALAALLGLDSKASAKSAAPKKKRTMSASARRKIAAAQKKRWAAFHAAKK